MRYVAIINVLGYPPEDTDPPSFDTAAGAWEYLWRERHDAITEADEGSPGDPYADDSETLDALSAMAASRPGVRSVNGVTDAGVGTIYGPTPGYDGDHDLGIAYSVEAAEEGGRK